MHRMIFGSNQLEQGIANAYFGWVILLIQKPRCRLYTRMPLLLLLLLATALVLLL